MHTSTSMELKMNEALDFNYSFFLDNDRLPRTDEDPYYRSARRYFNGAENYKREVFVKKGYSNEEIEHILNGTQHVTKEQVFKENLELYRSTKNLRVYSSNVTDMYGTPFYLRKEILEHEGYSLEDALYILKEDSMGDALTLHEVLQPLIDFILDYEELPKSYEMEYRGNIIRRFRKWDIAIEVALEHIQTGVSVDEAYKKHRPKYLPNIETLEEVINFIQVNNRLPRANEIDSYRKVVQEYLLWDNALDVALEELNYTFDEKVQMFKNR